MDNSSPQTRTMDKYLHIDSIPKRPKTDDVVRTAHYVLFHCKRNTQLRQSLETDLNDLINHQQQQGFCHCSSEKQVSQNWVSEEKIIFKRSVNSSSSDYFPP